MASVNPMIVGLMLVVGGLVLLTGSLYLIPALGRQLEKLAKFLGGFQALIGVIAIIAALWKWDDAGLGASLTLLIVGLILAVSVMSALPAVGKSFAKLAKWLGGFQIIIGIVALIVGTLELVV